MNILIIRGKDVHTCRIEAGFANLGCSVKTVTEFTETSTTNCDIVFIDPSYEGRLPNRFDSKHVLFYDSEDSPYHFAYGSAYESLKDSIKFYAKMNYVDNDRNDGIKNVAFPLPIYGALQSIASQSFCNFDDLSAKPCFIGHGTYIGKYQPVKNGWYSCRDDATSIGYAYNNGRVDFLYNQRLDWLMSAKQDGISVHGGIVFDGNDNLSLDWQKKHFGQGVQQFSHPPISWQESFDLYNRRKIALCPTGHERISWRIFDLMAAGAVIFLTDLCGQKSLFMPKEYITVKDGDRFSSVFESNRANMKNLWKAAQANKQFIQELNADRVLQQFFSQLS